MTSPKRIAALAAIAAALAPAVAAGAANADTPPPPNVHIGLFHGKWILPPRDSPLYATEKAIAQSAGYETVEFDDFSYPPPRV